MCAQALGAAADSFPLIGAAGERGGGADATADWRAMPLNDSSMVATYGWGAAATYAKRQERAPLSMPAPALCMHLFEAHANQGDKGRRGDPYVPNDVTFLWYQTGVPDWSVTSHDRTRPEAACSAAPALPV